MNQAEDADPGVGSSWRPIGPHGGGAGDRPVTPSNLFTVNLNTGGGVTVKWFDPSTDTIKSIIQRQTMVSGSWGGTNVFTVGPTSRAFQDKPGPGLHRYRVAGVNRAGTADFTPWVSIDIDASAPNAPSNLAISNMPPRITWNDNSDNETKFEVERQKAYGTQWGSAITLNVAADESVTTDTPGSGSFRYRVRAVNSLGPSSYTGWVQYSVLETPPNAPSDLALVGLESGNQPRLAWVDNSSNETSFEMERQKAYGTQWGSLVTSTFAADAATTLDNPGMGTFRYRVRAVNGAGPSSFTPYTIVTVADGLPGTPGNFQAADYGDGTSISMTWLDSSSNETGFEIQREKQTGSTWGQGTTLSALANTVSFNDGPGVGSYRYRIRAVNAVGASPYSAWVSAAVTMDPPDVPTGVAASDMGTRRALLSWSYDKADVSGFDIERSPTFSTGTVTVDASVHGYVDACGPGTFSYRVRTVGSGGTSDYSGWVQVTVSEIVPAAPTDLSVTDTGSQGQMRLVWQDNSTNESEFIVERQTMTDGAWGTAVQLPRVGADVTLLLDTAPAGQNRYRVCASNSTGQSAWTPWVASSISTGWTPLVPSADTRIVYVSSSTGNDSNSGLQEGAPVKTIARGYSLLRHKSPDWLLLKCGDTWNEGIPQLRLSGRSATEPLVISSYGFGDRPRMVSGPGSIAFARIPSSTIPPTIDNLWIVGLAFTCNGYNGDTQTPGVFWLGPGSNILFEDCFFQGFMSNLAFQSDASQPIRNLTLRRNIIVDSFSKDTNGHSQGIITGYVDGLNIIENVFDHNGWKEGVAQPTLFNHNMYIALDNFNVVVRGNISTRASSHGLQLRSGGVAEDNLFVRDPLAMFAGKSASTVRNNVVLEGIDLGDTPRGFGIDVLQVPNDPPTVVEGNIIANKISPNTYAQALGVGYAPDAAMPPPGTIYLRNNIVYNWKCVGIAMANGDPANYGKVFVTGNIIVEPTPVGHMVYHSPTSIDRNKFVYSANVYNTLQSKPFGLGGYDDTFDQWKSASGETNLSTAPKVFAGASRTTSSYNASLGGQASFEAFIAECRKQSKTYWRDAYTAAAVNAYIRDGFK